MFSSKFNIDLKDPEIAAHFPKRPILAAYKQMNLLNEVIRKNGKKLLGLKDVKFKSQITPPCEVEICIADKIFEIKISNQVKTIGKIILE